MFRRKFLGLLTSATLSPLAVNLPFQNGSDSFHLNKIGPPKGFGLAYGPYRQHESPDGLQPTEEEIREDLKLLKAVLPKKPRRVRVYSAIGPGGLAAIIASEQGFRVTLGAWIGKESDQNKKEINELIGLASFVHPELVVVGNESILRSDTTTGRLKEYIQQVKAALPGIMVSTAEPWATWVVDPRGQDLVDSVDVLTVHVHPFWEKTPVEQAPQAVFQRLSEVRNKFGKPVVLGETGWPSDGVPQGEAIPSQENQHAFIAEILRLYKKQDARVFLFSGFDEPFKGVAERGSDTDAAAEGTTGAHWGVFLWNRTLKPSLKDIFATPGDPNPMNLSFRVLTRGSLAPGFDLGLDTGLAQRNWIRQLSAAEAERPDGLPAFRLAFPDNQCWGTVFITSRKPSPIIQARRTTDVTDYDRLALDLRLLDGNDGVEIAPKTPEWPDDGTESKVVIQGLTKQWQTAVIPLSLFAPTDLKRLYVVCALNFFGLAGKLVDVAEIKFLPSSIKVSSSLIVTPLLSRQDLDPYVLSDGQVSCGYGLGIATAPPLAADWLQSQQGFLRLSYPGGREWGSAFFTVGNPPPDGGRKLSTDMSGRTQLALEVRGERGGEVCEVGVRSVTTSPFNSSLALSSFVLSTNWNWVSIPLTSLSATELGSLHVVASIEFKGFGARTIDVRNIRLL